MPLYLNKPIRTRDGREVLNLTVISGSGRYVLGGVICRPNGGRIHESWTAEGAVGTEARGLHPSDLVNFEEPTKETEVTIDLTKPVKTRSGYDVTILRKELRGSGDYPVLGLVHEVDYDCIETWTTEGKKYRADQAHNGDQPYDLVQAKTKYKGYIAIGQDHGSGVRTTTNTYKTREEAERAAMSGFLKLFVEIVEVEWEE